MEIRFPETDEEVKENRIRFLTELRKPENAPMFCRGTLFSPDGNCCALGIGARLFLGIRNYTEYNSLDGADRERDIYGEVERMLDAEFGLIEHVNDGREHWVSGFSEVADILAEKWGLDGHSAG